MPFRRRNRLCDKRFSVKVKIITESSELGYRIWAIAAYLVGTSPKSESSMKPNWDLSITQKTVWHLAHCLRNSIEDNDQNLNGVVDADNYVKEGSVA